MAASESPDLGPVNELDERERDAVEALLFRLADDELVAAERYTEWQVRAPTLESDIALANIAQDELGHARLWYEVLEAAGYDESDLIWERDSDDFQHSTLVECPFEQGDWADAIVRTFLYDVAEDIRMHALEGSSVPVIRGRVGKILKEEEYHLQHATNWIERLASTDDGRERVQHALNRLFPYALTVFEPIGDVESTIDDLGVRTRTLPEMREEWFTRVEEELTRLGIEVPGVDLPAQYDEALTAEQLPGHRGRDGDHTADWAALHDEMTSAYRNLGRDDATRIMDPSDDE